jgi:hypothetical protein
MIKSKKGIFFGFANIENMGMIKLLGGKAEGLWNLEGKVDP